MLWRSIVIVSNFRFFTGRGEHACFVCIVKIYFQWFKIINLSNLPSSSYSFAMLTLSIISLFMLDTSLDMAEVSSTRVVIGMVGGAGEMNGRLGTAGKTCTAIVDLSDPGTSGVVSLSLLPFLHERGVFFWSCCQWRCMTNQEKKWWQQDLFNFYSKE